MYLDNLKRDPKFVEFFLRPVEELRDRALMTLRSSEALERQLFTAQGALTVLDALDDLLSRPMEDLKRRAGKK